MTVLELVGTEAERAPQELVAEADTEEGQARVKHLAQQGDLTVGGGRVTGTVGEEDTVGAHSLDVGERGGGRKHVHLDAPLRQVSRRAGLDAQVQGGDGVPLLPDRAHYVGTGGGDLTRERSPAHER